MKNLAALLLSIWAVSDARAQDGPEFSLGAGTLGATLEVGYQLNPNFGIRGIAGYAGGTFSDTYEGAPLSGTATIGGVGVLADMYLGGGIRLTAGAIAPNYGAEMRIAGDITIEGYSYSGVDIAASVTSTNKIAPVLAVGYEKSFGNHWGVTADLGAMYVNGFTISATDNSGQISDADITTELAETNADLANIPVLPFVKIGVSFAF